MEIFEVATVLISVMALGLTVYQAIKIRQHNILTVKPLLRVGWNAGETADGIWIANNGLGPAIITSIKICKNGKKVTIRDLEDRLFEHGIEARMGLAEGETVIDTGETCWIVRTRDQVSSIIQREFWNELEGLTVHLVFKDLYGVSAPRIEWQCPNPIEAYVRPRSES